MFVIKGCVYSDRGNYRENNEDNYYIGGNFMEKEQDKGKVIFKGNSKEEVFAVFDGLGGEAKGEIASYMAAKTMNEMAKKFNIKSYFEVVNNNICQLRKNNHKEMIGTTACIVYINDNSVVISNIGDSKIYLIRNGKINQLSKDHTMLAAMIEAGVLTESDIKNYKYKNYLSQCLGIEKTDKIINPYIKLIDKIQDDDIFILCTDGVSDILSHQDMYELVKNNKFKNSAECLVKQAIKLGTKDNATALTIKICKPIIKKILNI